VYRVEKSKDCNRSGKASSTSDLKRLSLFITSTTPVESLRIQLLTQGTSAFFSLDTQRSLTAGNIALKKELSHLETSVRKVELAAAEHIAEKPLQPYFEGNVTMSAVITSRESLTWCQTFTTFITNSSDELL
jgi:hypothetical protein